MKLSQWWRDPNAQRVIRAYTGLAERERLLTALTLNVILAAALLAFLLWPLLERNRELYSATRAQVSENQQLHQRLAELRSEELTDPNQPLRDELQRTQEQQQLLDERISSLTSALIPPAQMTSLLGNVLAGRKDLRPLELTTLAPVRMSLGDGFENVELYRHGLRLRARATYPALLGYLQALDELPWVIGWEALDYQVQTYPAGEFVLEVSALSRQQEVLGGR